LSCSGTMVLALAGPDKVNPHRGTVRRVQSGEGRSPGKDTFATVLKRVNCSREHPQYPGRGVADGGEEAAIIGKAGGTGPATPEYEPGEAVPVELAASVVPGAESLAGRGAEEGTGCPQAPSLVAGVIQVVVAQAPVSSEVRATGETAQPAVTGAAVSGLVLSSGGQPAAEGVPAEGAAAPPKSTPEVTGVQVTALKRGEKSPEAGSSREGQGIPTGVEAPTVKGGEDQRKLTGLLKANPEPESRGGEAHAAQETPNRPGSMVVAQENGGQDRITDVKKLIDFENHRSRGSKLTGAGETQKPGDDTVQVAMVERNAEANQVAGLKESKPFVSSRLQVDTGWLLDQVVKKCDLLVRDNLSEMKMVLKPEFLGRLTIKIAVEDNLVTARFVAESAYTRQLLEASLPELKTSLEANGIKLDRAEVAVAHHSGQGLQGQPDFRGYSTPSQHGKPSSCQVGYGGGEPVAEPRTDAPGSRSGWAGAVDYLV